MASQHTDSNSTSGADPAICPGCGRQVDSSVSTQECLQCLMELAADDSLLLGEVVAESSPVSFSGVLKKFGDYELLEEIARGGMGVVYRAEQTSLRRTVAIKLILAGQLATPEAVHRFRTEAEATAKLDHPGIVPIYEIGEQETQHFFSMKFIDGGNLAQLLDEFALTDALNASDLRQRQREIATLIAQVARAIDYAHQHGVLHRDIKPTNILVDRHRKPHLTDFGLAKLTGPESSGSTLSATVLGSPSYMAPEQAAGNSSDVTTLADVYGLGAVLYELLTRQPPFHGKTALDTMRQLMDTAPRRPTQINSNVHPDLETIALKCLEKNPQQRYPSAAAMAEELDRFVRGEPILARPAGTIRSLRSWCQRNPVISMLVGCLLVAFVVGLTTVTWQWQRAERANENLSAMVGHFEMTHIDRLLEEGQGNQALSYVAAAIRGENSSQAAMLGASIMDNYRFAVPIAPPLVATEAGFSAALLSSDGSLIATLSRQGRVDFYDAQTSDKVGDPLIDAGGFITFDLSPDGRRVVTGSQDGVAQLWDVLSGSRVGEPIQESHPVRFVQFSTDGKTWMALSGRKLHVRDEENASVRVIKMDRPIRSAMFSADGEIVMTAASQGSKSIIQLWNIASGTQLARLEIARARQPVLSPDASRIAVLSGHDECRIYDVMTGDLQTTMKSMNGHFDEAFFNPDGEILGTIGINQWARLWDCETGLPLSPELHHDFLVEGADFSADGRWFYTWSIDATARVWDGVNGRIVSQPLQHGGNIEHMQMEMSGKRPILFTVQTPDGGDKPKLSTARLWRLSQPVEPMRFQHDPAPSMLDAVVLSPDEQLVACAKSNELWLLDAKVNGPIAVPGDLYAVLFTPDSQRLIGTGPNGLVIFLTVSDGKPWREPIAVGAGVKPADITTDGSAFAIGLIDGRVQIRDCRSGKLISEYAHNEEPNSVCFSPNGQLIVSGAEDHTALVYETMSGKIIAELSGHTDEVMSVDFHPDGRHVLTTSRDFTARVWDLDAPEEPLIMLRHQGEVVHAEFSPDGRLLATAARDRAVGLWSFPAGQLLHPYFVHQQAIRNVRFSQDSSRLLALAFNGPRVWDVQSGNPLTAQLSLQVRGGTGVQSRSLMPTFSSDGSSILIGTDTLQATLWKLPALSHAVPEWFPELLEAVAGRRLQRGKQSIDLVPARDFLLLRQKILHSRETDVYTTWAKRWLAFSNQAAPIE